MLGISNEIQNTTNVTISIAEVPRTRKQIPKLYLAMNNFL